MKKQRKSKASLRKKKRQRAKNKREREKGNVVGKPNYNEENPNEDTPVKKDSLHYSFTTTEEDKYIIIKFNKTDPEKKDSILIKYPDRGDEISDYDKQILKNYIDSNKVKISSINVREHIGTKEEDKHQNKHTTPLKRNLKDHFIQLGIPPEKITFK